MASTEGFRTPRHSLISTAISWGVRLLTDSRYYWHLFSLIFLGEVALCALVIRYVACEQPSSDAIVSFCTSRALTQSDLDLVIRNLQTPISTT
jgi:hypothetical protein